jgi:transmembrane sensor
MERPEAKLVEFGAAVREALAAESSASGEIRLARAGFLQHVATRNATAASRPRRASAHPWRFLLLAGATAAAAIAVWTWTHLPISFQVGAAGAPGQPGDLVSAAGTAPTPLHFSEGSSLVLHEGGRLRVLATEPKGARVLVENGTVDVDIAPARLGKKQWYFEAGPFSVLVTGTKFKMSYRALDQSFGLAMQEGRVVVAGACLDRPTPVTAGGHLDLSCLAKPKRPEPYRVADLSGIAPPPRPTPPVPASASRPARDGEAWRDLLAAGRLQEGLRAAERASFGRVCQTATAKELLGLADGASLFGSSKRAVTALRVLRQRFPASPEASTAAFTLGRIAFEQKHAYAEAASWFATYLREQPSGPLMGDSVGRLMEARLRAGDQTGARTDAEQYLRRFPEGPYASEARGILSK